MSESVFKLVEAVGCSATSIEDAVNAALSQTAKTVQNLRWFEVVEIRGAIDADKARQWQVTLKIGSASE